MESGMKHVPVTHGPECGQTNRLCPICDGGLFLCVVCNLAEGELTTDCPGSKCGAAIGEHVMQGRLDFVGDSWVQK
jgi:hypothetical protein